MIIEPAKLYFSGFGKDEIKIKKMTGKKREMTNVLNVEVNPFLNRKNARIKTTITL